MLQTTGVASLTFLPPINCIETKDFSLPSVKAKKVKAKKERTRSSTFFKDDDRHVSKLPKADANNPQCTTLPMTPDGEVDMIAMNL